MSMHIDLYRMNKGSGHESFRLLAEIRILDNMRNCTNNSEGTRGF